MTHESDDIDYSRYSGFLISWDFVGSSAGCCFVLLFFRSDSHPTDDGNYLIFGWFTSAKWLKSNAPLSLCYSCSHTPDSISWPNPLTTNSEPDITLNGRSEVACSEPTLVPVLLPDMNDTSPTHVLYSYPLANCF